MTNKEKDVDPGGNPSAYSQTRYTLDKARDKVWRVLCRYLQRYIPPLGSVLDLGAGYCSFINNIQAAEKHAVDLFPGFVHFAAPDVKASIGNSNKLDYPPHHFDCVFASNLLEHLTRDDGNRTLSEVRRVLKPGGLFLAMQPNFRFSYRSYFDDYTHQQIFTHVSLADWLTAEGFRVEHVEPRFMPFSFKSRLPTWEWLVDLYLHLPFRPLAKQMLVVARSPS